MIHGLKIGDIFCHHDSHLFIVVGENEAKSINMFEPDHSCFISRASICKLELNEALEIKEMEEVPDWIYYYHDCISFENEYV